MLAISLVGSSLLVFPAAGPAKGVLSCDRRAGKTLVANREVRIFERRRYVHGILASTSTYACNRRSGRLRYFQDAESGKDSGSTRRPMAAGAFVAYMATTGEPTIFV